MATNSDVPHSGYSESLLKALICSKNQFESNIGEDLTISGTAERVFGIQWISKKRDPPDGPSFNSRGWYENEIVPG